MSRFENKILCLKELSESLNESRLVLFIGAGISTAFGLPSWDVLIENLCQKSGVSYTKTKNEDLAKLCLNKLGNKVYKITVKEILYENFQLEKIINFPLLVSLCALCTGSGIRGSVKSIVTYNFDDILEKYFYYYGIVPEIIKEFPFYHKKSDIRIYHPHGYLPYSINDDSEKIALDTSILNEVKKSDSFWPELEAIVKHNTLLFIGLSFNDINLKELIEDNKDKHPSAKEPDSPIGFYFVASKDIDLVNCNPAEKSTVEKNIQKMELLELDRIFPIIINGWSEIPSNLCKISQDAMNIALGK